MARGKIYNKVFTDELWATVNPINKEIMEDFLAEYKQRRKSAQTLSAYKSDLQFLLCIIAKRFDNKSVLEMSKRDFRGLSILLTDEYGMSPARTNRLKSSINSMLTFCEEDDEYDYEINYAKKVKGIPNERVKDDEDDFFFTYDEFIKVRDILVSQDKLQLAVLWSIGFDSAGRRNELLQIEKHGLINGNKTNVVIGKRGKKFNLVYLDDTKELIRKYLEKRGDDNIDSLWYKEINGVRTPIQSETIYDRILSISKILSDVRGEECNIFPHTMRHSRLESLAQGTDKRLVDKDGNPKKFPLEQIQVFAHHSDVSTTQGYLKDHSDDTINEMFGF